MTDEINAMPETGVNQMDYMKLFMQELTYQDPLKPVDNREFMAQMAQFSSLQEARTTNESLTQLMSATCANQSLMMLGKDVKINGSDGIGKVRQVQFPRHAPPKILIDMNGALVEKELTDITDVLS